MRSKSDVTARLVAAIESAHRERCPVAPGDPVEVLRLATLARRRWSSIAQRTKKTLPTDAAREEDLAKALRDALEGNRELVGRLMTDYRHLAMLLAKELRD